MKVISLSPFRCMPLTWQPRPGRWALTVVCKATYKLEPGEVVLADEQEALKRGDVHRAKDPSSSVYYPSDRLPKKAKVDVLLVGHARSPDRIPVRALRVRLVVGDVDKSIDVRCDRFWNRNDEIVYGEPVAEFDLSYERASTGPGMENPVGMRTGERLVEMMFESARAGIAGAPDAPIPNVQPCGCSPAAPGDDILAIGFGPLAPTWPERQAKLGGRAAPAWSAPDGAPVEG
jgi:hypothetical protein